MRLQDSTKHFLHSIDSYQPLVIALLAVASGIVFDRFRPISLGFWILTAAASLSVWCFAIRRSRQSLGHWAVLMAIFTAAGAWHHCYWRLYAQDEISRFARLKDEPVCIEALVLTAPRILPKPAFDPLSVMPPGDCWQCDVEATRLRDDVVWRPVTGRATLMVIGEPPLLASGDRLRCFARLSAFQGAANPGGFDRAAFFRTNRVRCRLELDNASCVTVLEHGSAWSCTNLLQAMRRYGDWVFAKYLDPRQAELASAVLLGLREELDGDRNEAFLTTGTIHILSISGLHIGILAGVLLWLMRRSRVPRQLCAVLIGVVIIVYALIVDAEPPVVRSVVLVLVLVLALLFRREPLSMNSLAAAALVVLAMNPAHLFNVGTQLSFLCVAVLIWVAATRANRNPIDATLDRLVQRNLGWGDWIYEKTKSFTWNLIIAGFAVWAVTLPLVLARFHVCSNYAAILNPILWGFVGLSMLSGFILLMLAAICPPLAWICAWLCNASFAMMEWLVDKTHHLPGSHFWMPGPTDWWLWIFYGGLGLWLACPKYRPRPFMCLAILLGWIAVAIVDAKWPHDREQLDCTFVSMGHGCAVLVELPSGKTLLYDAGQFGRPQVGVRSISSVLWSRNITHIDAVVLSHPDVDHFNALPGLLEKFSVGEVCVSPRMFEKDTRTVQILHQALEERAIPIRMIQAGDHLQTEEDCRIEVLHPPRNSCMSPGNADSIVLGLNFRGRRVLLPGDIESTGLEALLKQGGKPCEVLLAPHHGSRKSNQPNLAEWCKARWVIFSGDGRWSLPEVEAPYRALGGEIYHTYLSGAVQVHIRPDNTQVVPFIR